MARVASCTIGALLIYVGGFLYETQEGKIKSKLEGFWIAVDDAQQTLPDRRVAFLREVAWRGGIIFDRVFGDRLFSRRFFVVSIYLSVASLSIWFKMGVNWLVDRYLSQVYYRTVLLQHGYI